ncbi:MAG: hemolysin family protein [Rickettsiales bacterium]|nr:hemolysin family protein [Rickettsiales bacterium]
MNTSNAQETTEPDLSQKISQIKNKIVKFISPKSRGLRETIEEILDNKENSADKLEAGEKEIIRNVLEFKEIYVEDIMIPRPDIFAIPETANLQELKDKLIDKAYTRIPVYKSDLDEITGFIHIKDAVKYLLNNEAIDIKAITRKCLFVPGPMKISNLLMRMQKSMVHIAIVVDEYGGTEGLITMEDIIEEIVGKIDDEHDKEEDSSVKKINDKVYEVNARISIEDFYSHTAINLANQYDEEQYDTIGGLVYLISGRIPVKGEIIRINEEIEVEVLEADARTLKKILVMKR